MSMIAWQSEATILKHNQSNLYNKPSEKFAAIRSLANDACQSVLQLSSAPGLLATINDLAHMHIFKVPPLGKSKLSPFIASLNLDPPLRPSPLFTSPLKKDHPLQEVYDELITPDTYLGCRALNIRLEKYLEPKHHFNDAVNFIIKPLEILTYPENADFLEASHVQLPLKTTDFMDSVFKYGLPTFTSFKEGGCAALDTTCLKKAPINEPYVLKHPKKESQLIERKCLMKEAIISMRLIHPHILSAHAVSKNGLYFPFGSCFIEQVLPAHQNDRAVSPESLKKYFTQISQALAFIHKEGFTHKDVKTDNIILLEGNAYLIDFGCSDKTNRDSIVSGTSSILAPEMLVDYGSVKIFSNKIDVWAFGIVMIDSIFGHSFPMIDKLNHQYNAEKFLQTHLNKPLPANFFDLCYINHTLNTNIHQRDPFGIFRDIATKCLHGNPAERPSMEEVVSMLELAYTELLSTDL